MSLIDRVYEEALRLSDVSDRDTPGGPGLDSAVGCKLDDPAFIAACEEIRAEGRVHVEFTGHGGVTTVRRLSLDPPMNLVGPSEAEV